MENLGLVKKIAFSFKSLPSWFDYDDCTQVGAIALMKATEEYDPNHRVAFSTYCSLKVKHAIIDEIRRLGWGSRAKNKRTMDNNTSFDIVSRSFHKSIDDKDEVDFLILDLTQRELQIIMLRYRDQLSLVEIGDALEVKESRISQILKKILFKLKERAIKNGRRTQRHKAV